MLAQYIPKINLPLEAVEHARWLERRSVDHEARILELERLVKTLMGQNNVSARPGETVVSSGGGLPLPAPTGTVLRGRGPTAAPIWTYEWQGLMPEYYVVLEAGFPVASTAGLALPTGDYSADGPLTQRLLPQVEFADDGRTMLPIDYLNFPDAVGPLGTGAGEAPIFLHVDVIPGSEGEEFTIHLPTPSNVNGVSAPYYVFTLTNVSDTYTATVNIEHTELFYPLSNVPVNGDVDTWTLAPSYAAGWHVSNVRGFGAVAMPVAYKGVGGAVFFSDPYYAATFWP